jgi:hypothetical protein
MARGPRDVHDDPPRLVLGEALHLAVGAGAGRVDSLFSAVMGNHLAVVVPLSRVVRTRIHEFPVHLSSRIEPRLPPAEAFVMTIVKHAPCLLSARIQAQREQESQAEAQTVDC